MNNNVDSILIKSVTGQMKTVTLPSVRKSFSQVKTPEKPVILKSEFKPQSQKRIQPQPVSVNNKKTVGRNDPCPCGAKHPDGRPIKYKHCHGR